MIEFIIKYWLEFLFGLVVAGLSAGITYYKKQYKTLKEFQKNEKKKTLENVVSDTLKNAQNQKMIKDLINERVDKIQKDSSSGDENLQKSLNEIKENLKTLQDGFIVFFCDRLKDYSTLLLEKPFIYLDELENFQSLYDSYKALGGNGHMEEFYHRITHLPIKNREEG